MAIPTPISFWNFDASSGNAADALGVNTLTNNNTTPYVAGLIGNAADLERGSSQSFSITDGAQTGLDFSGDMSVAAWVNIESTNDTSCIVAKTNGDSARSYIFRILGSGDGTVLNVEIYGDGTTSNRRGANSNAAFIGGGETGTWVHMAATFDVDTGAVVLYKNGSSFASTASNAGTVASIYNSTNAFQAGAANYLGTPEQFYDGKLDMLGVWNVTLTAGQVSELYNAGAGIQYPFASAVNSGFFRAALM